MPPLAASNSPARACAAPVNAPFSLPKSSLSSSDSASAAQLMPMNGPFARGECAWMARARTSLPTPGLAQQQHVDVRRAPRAPPVVERAHGGIAQHHARRPGRRARRRSGSSTRGACRTTTHAVPNRRQSPTARSAFRPRSCRTFTQGLVARAPMSRSGARMSRWRRPDPRSPAPRPPAAPRAGATPTDRRCARRSPRRGRSSPLRRGADRTRGSPRRENTTS